MIFVDTSAWYASADKKDRNHATAKSWLKRNREPLLTTDLVVGETLTLLKMRRKPLRALEVGKAFFEDRAAIIHRPSEEELLAAWQTFLRYSDKDWSFADCLSKVVMENLKITHAFAFDHHFRQFGSVVVVP